MKITRILTFEERNRMNDEAIAKGFYRDDRRIFLPGMAWFCPWYHDPEGISQKFGFRVMYPVRPDNVGPGTHGLSRFYWDKWAKIRAPICVVCPNGEQWEIDRVSNNGEGWDVSGRLPDITCSPSIVVPGYHGWLKNGEFSPDIEGRGENGTVQR